MVKRVIYDKNIPFTLQIEVELKIEQDYQENSSTYYL